MKYKNTVFQSFVTSASSVFSVSRIFGVFNKLHMCFDLHHRHLQRNLRISRNIMLQVRGVLVVFGCMHCESPRDSQNQNISKRSSEAIFPSESEQVSCIDNDVTVEKTKATPLKNNVIHKTSSRKYKFPIERELPINFLVF